MCTSTDAGTDHCAAHCRTVGDLGDYIIGFIIQRIVVECIVKRVLVVHLICVV